VFGDVGAPQLVRPVHDEVPVDQVGVGLGAQVTDRAAATPAPVQALDTGAAHQASDPLVVDRHTEAEGQLGVHPRPPIGASGPFMNLLDVFEQHLVFQCAGRSSNLIID
jgi:hypothetical protein